MRGYTDMHTPSPNRSRFELSAHDMPALYAWSTRDYDEGLGLLAAGNIIGELCLFSLAPDTFCGLKDAIQSVGNLSWTGREPLPQVSIGQFSSMIIKFIGSEDCQDCVYPIPSSSILVGPWLSS